MHSFPSNRLSGRAAELVERHWGRGQASAWHVSPQPWAAMTPLDRPKVEAFLGQITTNVLKELEKIPAKFQPDNIQFFAEPHISPRLTAGNYPEYFGDPPFEYTVEEQKRLKMFFETSRLAAEHFRKTMPDRKILIPWGDPLFIVPLLRAGFPTSLVDGCGIDVPNFERLPEMQLADNVVHRLYQLRQELNKVGMTNPELFVSEGIFVPTEPGACTWREQMDIYNRWALIFMAYGVKRFHAGWFAFDGGDYYGSEHYGGCGIQRRIPYCDPKPAYAAFATLTDKLNEADYDGWLPTGSLSTYALRFRHETRGCVYPLWTLRGRRPVTLTLNADGKVRVTDAMNNTRELVSSNRQVAVMTDPSVVYVSFADPAVRIESVAVGEPEHADAAPSATAKQVADLGDGTWRYTDRREPIYEGNHWGFYPALGSFRALVTNEAGQGPVLASVLGPQARERQLMPWYNILKPAKPVALPGAPSHLGLWVKGDSGWGRVIYILRDAQGERWLSIGTKDDYNCDDVHSWSRFCFDGWRYLRFELPGHTGPDLYRKAGTTWWRSAAGPDAPSEKGDQIVDLPLALEEILVEQRTHILYVNDPQPVESDTILLGRLFVEYEQASDATEEAVRVSRLRLPPPPGDPKNLPNPIADLARDGVGEGPRILRLSAPEHQYDGTRMHVHFEPLPGTNTYHLWVGAHADGRGAVNLRPQGVKPGDLVTGLRPGIKLYYWLTSTDAKGVVSKPSPVHAEVTEDHFKEK